MRKNVCGLFVFLRNGYVGTFRPISLGFDHCMSIWIPSIEFKSNLHSFETPFDEVLGNIGAILD